MSTPTREEALAALHAAEAALQAAEAVVTSDAASAAPESAPADPVKFLPVEGALGPTAINGG